METKATFSLYEEYLFLSHNIFLQLEKILCKEKTYVIQENIFLASVKM